MNPKLGEQGLGIGWILVILDLLGPAKLNQRRIPCWFCFHLSVLIRIWNWFFLSFISFLLNLTFSSWFFSSILIVSYAINLPNDVAWEWYIWAHIFILIGCSAFQLEYFFSSLKVTKCSVHLMMVGELIDWNVKKRQWWT